MKIHITFPWGGEIKFERQPICDRKFEAVCRVLSFGLYVALTWVISATNDIFALFWFYLLTAVLAGGWMYCWMHAR